MKLKNELIKRSASREDIEVARPAARPAPAAAPAAAQKAAATDGFAKAKSVTVAGSGKLGSVYASVTTTLKATAHGTMHGVERASVLVAQRASERELASTRSGVNRAVTHNELQSPVPGFSTDEVAKMGAARPYYEAGAAALDKHPPDVNEALRQADLAEKHGGPSGLNDKLRLNALKKVPEATDAWLKDHGFDNIDSLKKAGPHAVNAAVAFMHGDFAQGFAELAAFDKNAPKSVETLRQWAVDHVPQGVKDFLSEHGVTDKDIKELGHAAPAIFATASALMKGDFAGALQAMPAIHMAAPGVAKKLQDELVKLTPDSVKSFLKDHGISDKDLRELGDAALPTLQTVQSIAKGDWANAFVHLAQIDAKAPDVVRKLEDSVLSVVPKDVKDFVSNTLGFSDKDLKQFGKAGPEALMTLLSLKSGDWHGALTHLAKLDKASPELVKRVEDKVVGMVPQPIKDELAKLGISGKDLKEFGKALPSVIDAAVDIKKGDWQAVLKDMAGIDKAAPNLVKGLNDKFVSMIPSGVKDALAKVGLTGDALKALGKLSPQILAGAVNFDLVNTQINDRIQLAGGDKTFKPPQLPDLSSLSPDKALDALKKAMDVQIDVISAKFGVGGALFSAQGSWGTKGGPLYMEGSVKFGEFYAGGAAAVSAGWNHLQAGIRLEAGFYAVDAHGHVTADIGPEHLDATGDAKVGAYGVGDATVNLDPFHGTAMAQFDGDAFVGARASLGVKESLGPIGVQGGASVAVGFGVHAAGDIGFKDGKFNMDFDFGIAAVLGVDIKFGLSIDVKSIVNGAKDAVKAVGKGAVAIAKGAAKAVGWVGEAAGKAAKAVGHAVSSAAKAVGNAVSSAAQSVGHAVSSAASSVGHAIASVFSGW